MTDRRPSPAFPIARVLAATALALSMTVAGPGRAAEPAGGSAGYGGGSAGGSGSGEGTSRRLDISIGRSVILDLPRDAKEVFVGNPGVANAVVRSTRKIFLIGISNGSTSVFVMDGEGRQIATFEVNVGRDLSVLRQTLRTLIPTGRIDVRAAGDSILLTGIVQSAGDAQQAMDVSRAFVGQTSPNVATGGANGVAVNVGGGGAVAGTVINGLTISGRDQVMLRVSVVEVARSAVKQLGINVAGSWNVVDVASGFVNPLAAISGLGTGLSGTVGTAGANISGGYQTRSGSVGGTLTALERAGVSRVLAEPTLVAVSGESATFVVGGEIPISIGCGSAICTPTITYKPYGVQLAFTPVVLSEGRISLRVATEVSEIDRENAVGDIPGFRTRKTTTSVELPSGATMMTAGLISNTSSQIIQGVPGLINLPILGTLFRSRDFQRRESELMIMVTPYVAKPMEAAQVKRPDDGFGDTHDAEAIFLGKLNKIYGVAGSGGAVKAGPSGRFGFITD